jgi:hypothetical protein
MTYTSTKIFGLLTDFGFDYAVASMKGVIAQTFPTAQIIDIDHSLSKFSIASASFIIEKSARYFPKTMIFICVVDPGVGSERGMLCVQAGSQWFVGPDNGIFHHLFQQPNAKVYRIKSDYFISESRTFHGRDIFTPAAVKLAQNQTDFLEAVDDVSSLISLPSTVPTTRVVYDACVTYIDSFGNIKTNLTLEVEPSGNSVLAFSINNKVHSIPWQPIFAHVARGNPLCYKGSNDTLEIAVNNGSAQNYFGVEVGMVISVSF